jgi:hypothetical protein
MSHKELTPRAKKVIEFAVQAAREMSHNYIGTEHLLMGCLREPVGIAGEVLRGLGVTEVQFVHEFRKLVGHPVLESPEQRKDMVVPKKITGEWPNVDLEAFGTISSQEELVAAGKQVAYDMQKHIEAEWKIKAEKEEVDLNRQVKECGLFIRRRMAEMQVSLQAEVHTKFPEIAPWIDWMGPAPQKPPIGNELKVSPEEVEKIINELKTGQITKLPKSPSAAPPGLKITPVGWVTLSQSEREYILDNWKPGDDVLVSESSKPWICKGCVRYFPYDEPKHKVGIGGEFCSRCSDALRKAEPYAELNTLSWMNETLGAATPALPKERVGDGPTIKGFDYHPPADGNLYTPSPPFQLKEEKPRVVEICCSKCDKMFEIDADKPQAVPPMCYSCRSR